MLEFFGYTHTHTTIKKFYQDHLLVTRPPVYMKTAYDNFVSTNLVVSGKAKIPKKLLIPYTDEGFDQ